MLRISHQSILTTVLLTSVSIAGASVITTTPDQFNVLAGGTLNTGTGVSIQGLSGAKGNVYLGNHTTTGNSIYTTGTFGTDHHSTVNGMIVSTGNVSIGQQSQMGAIDTTGSIFLDQKVNVAGNIQARQSINIGQSSVIGGDVNYGGSIWKDKKVTINGDIGRDTSSLANWTPTLRTDEPMWVTGSQNLYFGSGSVKAIDPGSYGSFSADSNSVIYLSAGTYDFSSIWLGSGVRFVADPSAGSVVVRVANGFSTSNKVSIEGGDKGNFSVLAKGSIYLGSNNTAQANLMNFGNSLSIDQNCQVKGTIYSSSNIWLGNNTAVAMGAFGPSQVPEPSTLLLCAGGLVYLSHRSKKAARMTR
jgi:predicted acyltransferase (DUF342 family)